MHSMDTGKGWKSLFERKKLEAALFERKFIDYRNKMLEIHDELDESNPLKNEIKRFMEDEQNDVEFD